MLCTNLFKLAKNWEKKSKIESNLRKSQKKFLYIGQQERKLNVYIKLYFF